MVDKTDWENLRVSHVLGEDLEGSPLRLRHDHAEDGRDCAWWHDEPPSWLRKEGESELGRLRSVVTVYSSQPVDAAPATIWIKGEPWDLWRSFEARAEAECPFRDGFADEDEKPARDEHGRCRYCEEPITVKHGHVYIGETRGDVYAKRVLPESIRLDLDALKGDGWTVKERMAAFAKALRVAADRLEGDGEDAAQKQNEYIGDVAVEWST